MAIQADDAAVSTVPGGASVADQVVDRHPDDLELEEAEAALAAEAAGEGGAVQPEPELTPEELTVAGIAQPAAGTGKDGGAGQPTPMIPKPRLDAVLASERALELDNARLKGQLEALQAKPAAPAAATEPAKPDPNDLSQLDRKSIDARLLELANAFDNGDMTLSQVRAEEIRLYQRRDELVIQASEHHREQKDHLAVVNDKTLANLTGQLEQQNPWLSTVPAKLIPALEALAEEELEAQGVVVNDPASMLMLRAKVVEIAAQRGYGEFKNPFDKKKGAAEPTPTPTSGKPANPAVTAKLALAARQPPNTAMPGRDGQASQLATDNVDDLSEDEIAALPDSALERFAPTRVR